MQSFHMPRPNSDNLVQDTRSTLLKYCDISLERTSSLFTDISQDAICFYYPMFYSDHMFVFDKGHNVLKFRILSTNWSKHDNICLIGSAHKDLINKTRHYRPFFTLKDILTFEENADSALDLNSMNDPLFQIYYLYSL